MSVMLKSSFFEKKLIRAISSAKSCKNKIDSLEAKLHREIRAHSKFFVKEEQRRSGNLTDRLRGVGKVSYKES
jgi:hypothetical protein